MFFNAFYVFSTGMLLTAVSFDLIRKEKQRKSILWFMTLIVPVPHAWHGVESHPHGRDDDEDERDERYSLRQRQR